MAEAKPAKEELKRTMAEEPAEEAPERSEQEEFSQEEIRAFEAEQIRKAGALISPEGLIMLGLAVFIDAGEALLDLIPLVGNALSVALDIFAVFFFGFWMWFRSGSIQITSKMASRVKAAKIKVEAKIAKSAKWAKRLKWLRPLCFVIEVLLGPLSSLLPFWALVVYMELKHH